MIHEWKRLENRWRDAPLPTMRHTTLAMLRFRLDARYQISMDGTLQACGHGTLGGVHPVEAIAGQWHFNQSTQLNSTKRKRIMKKLIIAAIILVSVAAMGQKPNNIGMSEVLEITSVINLPVVIMAKDENGSPYVRVEMDTLVTKKYVKNTQKWPRANTHEVATIVAGKLRWQVMSHVSFLEANPKTKDNWGFVAFQSSVGVYTPDVPAITVYYAGLLETKWDEAEQRFRIVKGKGTISGFSNNNSIIKEYTDEAAFGLQDRYLPAFGTFTVRPMKYTDAQIKNILTK